MLQIKTIHDKNAEMFDDKVNEALVEGYVLIRRYNAPVGFVAELERVVITEAERCCDNCAHGDKDPSCEPCRSCTSECSEWEPFEGVML